MTKEGFSQSEYNPSGCIIPDYTPPDKRQPRLITDKYGGSFLVPAYIPPDTYTETISESIINNSIQPVRLSLLRKRVFHQIKAHPDDIEYVLQTMIDEDGDHKLNGSLTWRSDHLFQANSIKPINDTVSRNERFWNK